LPPFGKGGIFIPGLLLPCQKGEIGGDLIRKDTTDILKAGLKELGLGYTETQIETFLDYLSELQKWNKAYNLTALKTSRDIIIRHFLDSLLFARALPPETSNLADIGSGAGFPGVPLKIIFPRLSLSLIEPTQKKAIFLRHICNRLRLQQTEIIDKRVEEVNGLQVDVAVTRALFSIKEFISKTRHILNSKGVLVLSKGPGLEKELDELSAELRTSVSIEDHILPFENLTRHLVIVRR
jgi:16S rRNA (guanine527-N7)-methyltransferase